MSEVDSGSSTGRRRSTIRPLNGEDFRAAPKKKRFRRVVARNYEDDNGYSLGAIGRRGRASLSSLNFYQNPSIKPSTGKGSFKRFKKFLTTAVSTISFYLILKLIIFIFPKISNLSLFPVSQQPILPSQSPKGSELIQEEMRKATMARFRNANLFREETTFSSAVVPQKEGYNHEATVIFLHGLGESSFDAEIVPKLLAKSFPTIRWVLPVATNRAWFDSLKDGEDEEGIFRSVRALNSLIRTEMSVLITEMRKNDLVDGGNQVDQAEKSYAAKKIVLSGFSQGAAISLVTGLTGEFEFAGIASLSGFLPLKNKLDSITIGLGSRQYLPIFWAHGSTDSVILPSESKNSLSILQNSRLGIESIDSNFYEGVGHEIWWSQAGLEMVDFKNWLAKVLPGSLALGQELEPEPKRLGGRGKKREENV